MAVVENRRSETTRRVPFAMDNPLRVPAQRYYDREFFELETQYLWPRVWQMACRLEEIPEPGDFVEYEICDQSIIVVRQADSSIKAFHNACRHRATQLCKGTGRLHAGQIVCPFHGWRWNLDGSSSFVYGEQGFAPECMQPDDIALQECKVDTWGACAWINMDPDARPLREALSPGAELLDNIGAEDMRVWWWKETVVNANWKMAQEAFHEGYHVMATHPQLAYGMGEDYPVDNVEYTAFENGHARFQGRFDPSAGGVSEGRGADEFLARSRTLWEGQDAMTLERDIRVFESMRDKVAPGEDFPTAAIQALIAHSAEHGIPLRTTPEATRLVGRRDLPLSELLHAPDVRQRALVSRSPLQRRPGVVPLRGVVTDDVPRGGGARPGEARGALRDRRRAELGPDPPPGLQQHDPPATRRPLDRIPGAPARDRVGARDQQHAPGARPAPRRLRRRLHRHGLTGGT